MSSDTQTLIVLPPDVADRLSRNQKDIEALLKKFSAVEVYMTLEEAAAYIRKSTFQVRRTKDKIGYFKEGKNILFKKSDLDKYMNSIYHKANSLGSSERIIERT